MNPNNPPAFPCKQEIVVQDATGADSAKFIINHEGMSLRDYFAAKAMQGMMSSSNAYFKDWSPNSYTEEAYRISDAMLSKRKEAV